MQHKVWKILNQGGYTESDSKQLEELYDQLSMMTDKLGLDEMAKLCRGLEGHRQETMRILRSLTKKSIVNANVSFKDIFQSLNDSERAAILELQAFTHFVQYKVSGLLLPCICRMGSAFAAYFKRYGHVTVCEQLEQGIDACKQLDGQIDKLSNIPEIYCLTEYEFAMLKSIVANVAVFEKVLCLLTTPEQKAEGVE